MRVLIFMLLCLVGFSAPASAVKELGHNITFGPGGEYKGYFAPGKGSAKLPGIVMIHEWWGLNSNIRLQAAAYSLEGYNVLAVDLFGKTADKPAEAMKMVAALDQKKATGELLSASEYLRRLSNASGRVGSLGWCFGGDQSLILAVNDPKLNACVIYYGQPITGQAELAKIKCPILGFYGEEDKSIPAAKVREFDKALTEAVIPHHIYFYPGAGHAFANPTSSTAYKPEAAKDANKKAAEFLKEHLKTAGGR